MIERSVPGFRCLGVSLERSKTHKHVDIDDGSYWVTSDYQYTQPVIHLWRWNVKVPILWRHDANPSTDVIPVDPTERETE